MSISVFPVGEVDRLYPLFSVEDEAEDEVEVVEVVGVAEVEVLSVA